MMTNKLNLGTTTLMQTSQKGSTLSPLTLKFFDVGNGDCIHIEFQKGTSGIIDFYRVESLNDHPFGSHSGPWPSGVHFVCLTHPHRDHRAGLDKMEKMLRYIGENGGEFWHTIADIKEVIRLYQNRTVFESFKSRVLTRDLEHLTSIAKVVSKYFPSEKIRLLVVNPEMSNEVYSNSDTKIELNSPDRSTCMNYITMLRRIEKGEIENADGKIVNSISAVLTLFYGDQKILVGGDAPHDIVRDSTRKYASGKPKSSGFSIIKASHHGCDDSYDKDLWDDLFGANPALLFVSADGKNRPTQNFINSFIRRKYSHTGDKLVCTGALDPNRRPQLGEVEFQMLLNLVSQGGNNNSIIQFGTITLEIDSDGSTRFSQPFNVAM